MLKKISLGIATVATILAGSVSLSTPAAAHYTGYYHKHSYRSYCHYEYRTVKIYTPYGPRWVQRRVRVCS